MSFSDIYIYRDYPIKNGKVQLPPNTPLHQDTMSVDLALTLYPTTQVVTMSRSARGGTQEMLRLPPITPDTWYSGGIPTVEE